MNELTRLVTISNIIDQSVAWAIIPIIFAGNNQSDMTERKAIRESIEELEKFERNNPKIFQADGSVRFSALVTWEISGDKPMTDNDVYVGWYPDGSGRIHLERPDGIDGYEVYWRFYADISHYYLYDSSTNTLRIMDNRHYMEISIEPDLSIVELIELQKNVN